MSYEHIYIGQEIVRASFNENMLMQIVEDLELLWTTRRDAETLARENERVAGRRPEQEKNSE